MLTKIAVKNFKSLKSLDYTCAKLNLLTGLNGSGKSSLIQFLLFLKRMMAWDDPAGANCSIRAITPDMIYMSSKGRNWRELHFSITFSYRDIFGNCNNPPVEDGTFERSIGRVKDGTRYGYYSAHPDVFRFDTLKVEGEHKSLEDEYNARNELLAQIEGGENAWRRYWEDVLKRMRFVDACRVRPTRFSELSNDYLTSWDEMDPTGQNVAELLATIDHGHAVAECLRHPCCDSAKLLDQVNAWLGREISPGAFVHVDLIEEKGLATTKFGFDKLPPDCLFKPENVGTGLSNILPVLCLCLTADEGDTLLIENPELHLHPRGQAKMGELIARAVAAGAQVFVETHSDHVINGVRLAVKNGIVRPEDVNIAFFARNPHEVVGVSPEPTTEIYSEVTDIKVDEHGSLSDYPEDFMDEWNNQLMELLK